MQYQPVVISSLFRVPFVVRPTIYNVDSIFSVCLHSFFVRIVLRILSIRFLSRFKNRESRCEGNRKIGDSISTCTDRQILTLTNVRISDNHLMETLSVYTHGQPGQRFILFYTSRLVKNVMFFKKVLMEGLIAKDYLANKWPTKVLT